MNGRSWRVRAHTLALVLVAVAAVACEKTRAEGSDASSTDAPVALDAAAAASAGPSVKFGLAPPAPRVDFGALVVPAVQPDSIEIVGAPAGGYACGALDEVTVRPPAGREFDVGPQYLLNVACAPVEANKIRAWTKNEIRFVAPEHGGGLVWITSAARAKLDSGWLGACLTRARAARAALDEFFGGSLLPGLPPRPAPGYTLGSPGILARRPLPGQHIQPRGGALATSLVPGTGEVFGEGPRVERPSPKLPANPNQSLGIIRHGVPVGDCFSCRAVCVGKPCATARPAGWDSVGVPHQDVTCCKNFLDVGREPEISLFCAEKPSTPASPDEALFEVTPGCGLKTTKQSVTAGRDVQLDWRTLNYGSERAAPRVSLKEGTSPVASGLAPNGRRLHRFGGGPSTFTLEAENRCGLRRRTLELTSQPSLAFDPPELFLEPGEIRRLKLVHVGSGSGRVRLGAYSVAPVWLGPPQVSFPASSLSIGANQTVEIDVGLERRATALADGEHVASVGIDVDAWQGPEPSRWSLDVRLARPLRGFADLHVHQFSQLAFAPVLHGAASGPLEQLGSCYAYHGPNGTGDNYGGGMYHCIPALGCGCAGSPCEPDEECQPHPAQSAAIYEPLHDTTGYPTFKTWPSWHSGTHQQVHEAWLERAYRGGLRLMVMLASANQKFCQNLGFLLPHFGSPRPLDCSSKRMEELMGLQIDAAHEFARTHSWYVIVRTPAEASQAIRDGKLAVLLGLESGSLLECGYEAKDKPECSDKSTLEKRLDAWYARDVRYIFLVHREDSALAGPAFIDARVEAEKEDCRASGYEGTGQCAKRGLTEPGKQVLLAAWKKGMLVDIDHMSRKTKDAVIELARAVKYPLVAGHAQFMDLMHGKRRHEGDTTAADIAVIAELGGMVAPILRQSDYIGDITSPTGETESCGNSSQAFAMAYRYAVEKTGMAAIGSDFNGFGGVPSPRFGPLSCWSGHVDAKRGRGLYHDPARLQAQVGYAETRVTYPFYSIHGGWIRTYTMGERTLDVNTDSVAHIGLTPDFVAELEAQGVDVRPLLRSAEDAAAVWARATAAAARVP